MTKQEVLKLCGKGEQTPVQLKERVLDTYEVGKEIACYANERGGGMIIVGVNDKTGGINALSRTEIQEQSSLLSQIAEQNVKPAISIKSENVDVPGGQLIVVTIPEGINKPYRDNKGNVWVKNGANKRRVIDNAEIAEMMSDSGTFRQDEALIPEATIADLDMNVVKTYLTKRFEASYKSKELAYEQMRDATADELVGLAASGMTVERLFKNFGLIRPNGGITYAAMLLFGKHPWRWLPTATVKCVSMVGNSLGGTEFRDKMDDTDADGGILVQYEAMMSFLKRNLRNVQVDPDFNTLGQLEIPIGALSEICSNALLHRSYSWEAPIRLFVFDNRVEIHSPGALPGGLQVEDVLTGTSLPRNKTLFTHGAYLLPYSGVGSGFLRIRELDAKVEVVNDTKKKEVVVTFWRESNQEGIRVTEQSNGGAKKVTEFGNGVTEQSNGTHPIKTKLLGKVQDIVNYCTVPRAAAEILSRMGLTNQTKNRKKYINPLIEDGLLKLTIPDKPNDPNQKYVKA